VTEPAGSGSAPVPADAAPPLVVFLDRATLVAEIRRPRFAHRWVEHPQTAADEVAARLAGARIAITNKAPITAEVLEACPELRLVAVAATGVNNVELAAARTRGVAVCNVRDYARTAVAEHVLAVVLLHRRRLLELQRAVVAGAWSSAPGFCVLDHPGEDLRGATMVVVGAGGIGAEVARLSAAFGMRVLRAERRGASEVRPGRVPFETALEAADVLSLHCPLDADTAHLIDAAALARMKPTAMLVNTARGGLVDSAALAAALREGRLAGAAIDVLSVEPPVDGDPLLDPSIPNLLVTPHTAWATRPAMQALADQLVANLEAFQAGSPVNLVTS
jgi:glycerate dehydrogenase